MDEYVNMLPSFMPFSTVFFTKQPCDSTQTALQKFAHTQVRPDQLIIFWKRPTAVWGSFADGNFGWNLQSHEKLTEDFPMLFSLWYNASCLPTLIQKLKTVWRTANILIGPGLFPATLHLWHVQQASVFSHMTQGPSDVSHVATEG